MSTEMLPPHIPTASGCVGWGMHPQAPCWPHWFWGEEAMGPWSDGMWDVGCDARAPVLQCHPRVHRAVNTALLCHPQHFGAHRGPSPWAVGAGTQVTHLGGATTGRGFAVSRWLLRHFNLELFCVDISQRKISDFLSHNGIFLLQPIYQNGNKSPAWKSKHFLLVE